jgi:hypothetical protein
VAQEQNPPANQQQQQPAAGTQNPPASGSNQNPPPKKDDPAGKAGTLYGDLGVDEPGKAGSAAWPDDWRNQYATIDGKPDDKRLAQLKRFQSPTDLATSYFAAQERLRSGEYKQVSQAPDPKDEKAMSAWREENGIPKAAAEYDLIAPGVKFEELDDGTKKTIGTIQNQFLEANVPAGTAKTVATILHKIGEEQLVQQTAADAEQRDNLEDSLRSEWGRDYRPNLAMNLQIMERHFGDDMDAILMARTPDGRLLANLPSFNKAMNAWARGEGGDIMVDGEGSGGTSVDSRIAEIEGIMKSDMGKYLGTKGMPEEYAGLLAKKEARERRQ